MENDTGGEGIKTHDEENQLVSDVAKNIAEHKEVTAIEKKITTRTETFGIRIAGARVLSESGKVESVAQGIPPKETLLKTSPSPFYTSTQSMRHTSPIGDSASQTVVVESESSQVSSSTLSTEPILFEEGSPLAANASPDKPVPPPAVEVKPQETHTTQVNVSKDPVNEPGQKESSPQQTPNQATTNTDTVSEERDRKVEVESINEKIEEIKVEKAEESKVEKVEERKVDKSEESKEEKVEELKVETKVEKVEEPKVETVEEQKAEKVEEPKVEKVEEPKVEKVEEPKVEKVEEPKIEKVEEPKIEKVELPKVEPKIEKVEESKVESVEEPKVIEKTVKPEEPNPQLIQREPQAPRLDAPTAATETLHKELSPAHEREVVKPASIEVAPSPQPQIQKEEMAEIQEENIKNQLHEIIEEIDKEVSNEEDGVRSHTWKPKGHYEIKRTPIKYEEIVPISVPDVTVHEHQKTPSPPPKIEEEPPKEEQHALDPLKTLRSIVVNGEPLSPVEIPVGIPLLARILPKPESEDDEPREKIPLERLFTPATDAELLVPQKKKKAFASSCFYRPDHPTIDDQVELAHKISVSLVDENNKTSKGQNMYMKRKNRSSKWVHQGERAALGSAAQYDMEEVEEEKKPSMEKPALKLLLNPKGIQDYTAVQRHYEELMTTAEAAQQIARMEMSKEIASTMESPTGKGAALFAKRKKRMDKFIVDETNVQQPQPYNTNSIHEETTKSTEMVSSTQQSFSMSSTMQDAAHFDALMSAPLNGPNSLTAPKMGQPGHVQLPDLTQILTQPKLPEKTTTSSGRSSSKTTTSTRSRSADSKPHSKAKTAPGFASLYSQKPAEKVGANAKSVPGDTFQDSLLKLRPGTPPTYLVPDGTGHFIEKQTKAKTAEINSSTSSEVTANNEGGAIYKAEVKVVQKPSLPTTPLTDFPISSLPHHSILDQLEAAKEEEKRKSFNLAAKGWGTYNNFYTPVHLGTAV